MVRSANQIKELILFWYLKYKRKDYEEITGNEPFTMYDKIPIVEKEAIANRISLNTFELSVLITRIETLHWILNTTEHFIHINDYTIEIIPYKNFDWHTGPSWKHSFGLPKPVNPKVEGTIMPFGLKLNNQEVIYWPLPSGSAMFDFWNVTKKCNLIGRKYEIEEYKN